MENSKQVSSPQALVYSSAIVPPMTSETSLSSTLSAAISTYPVSGASILDHTPETTVINGATTQPILLPNSPNAKRSVGHAILQVPSSYSSHKTGPELQRGVIYALNHYSPFLSLSRPPGVHPSQTGTVNGAHNNLGPEDVAEVRQMTSAIAATSFHEHSRRSEAGKCQSGGELRLSELSIKLNTLHIPEGFILVGAKSPMLTGMMLVAAVDKRYLPGEKDTLTTPGFSGNCIGCGATGFRYFTEFSTHINLKLATQPKKQKHLKCYIVKLDDGKWGRGSLIPWKGTETKKRSHVTNPMPIIQQNHETFKNFQERFPEYHKFPSRLSTGVSNDDHPPTKKQKTTNSKESTEDLASETSSQPVITDVKTDDSNSVIYDDESVPDIKHVTFADDDEDSLESLNRSMSTVCGVRPVLLLCQEVSKKLPNSVDDLVVSDLLVGCFDFPDTLSAKDELSTSHPYSVISNATKSGTTGEEHNVATTLINMGGVNVPEKLESKTRFGNKSWPSVTQRLKEAATQTLPLNAAIILFTQYLINLEDGCINRENIELLLNKARIEMSTSTINSLFSESQTVAATYSQLSLMINLQCSASNGRVRVMTSTISFQNALYKALQWLNETFYISKVSNKKMHTPNFVIILSTPPKGPIEFGVLVTGVSNAKILAERLGINSIVCTDFAESLHKLRNQFNQTDTALNRLIKMHEKNQVDKVFSPFNNYPGMKILCDKAEKMLPQQAPLSAKPYHTKGIFANQAAMAHQLLKQLRNVAENPDILDLASFLKVDICIVVPPISSLYHMTVKRLAESGVLNFLGLVQNDAVKTDVEEDYVITYSDWPESIKKWKKFVSNVESRKDTLHVLIFDQAQKYSLPQGMPDVLPNLKGVFESVNVIPVFVTSVPYMFQTNKSFIDPDNEIYWTDTQHGTAFSKYTDDERVMINDQDMLYFGVKELCFSTKWHQQYALIRTEETLDWSLPKANRLNDINYSIVQGYVLLRLYQAALMVAAGVKPAEPYAIMSFISMVTDIIESPLHNADGSGSMLMIRIPNRQLSNYFHDVLLKTRDSLGMQYRIDVIHDDGERELEVGDHFLERMRHWRIKRGWDEETTKAWKPKCLEELLDLPCFLILSGEDRAGETLPRSLKYADLNILNQSKFHRSTIETEIGMCSCYLMVNGGTHSEMSSKPAVMNNLRTSCGTTYLDSSVGLKRDNCDGVHGLHSSHASPEGGDNCEACLSKDVAKQHMDTCTHFSSKYPLPIVLISKPLWLMLNSDQGDTRGLVHLNSDPNTRWLRSSRPLLMTTKPDRMSRYYRQWTEPRPARKTLTTPAAPSSPPSPGEERLETGSNAEDVDKMLATPSKPTTSERRDSEQIDHDDKDNEDSDKAQYHPRCFLFSGPPQAGKTGSYLYFTYLLHRMLLRLKRVDVYDNCVTYTPSSYDNTYGTEKGANVDLVAKWKFVTNFLDMTRENFSPVHVCAKESEINNPVSSSCREEGTNKALVILAKTALYDTLHHCDVCKFYREGIASTVTQTFDYQLVNVGELNETVDLKVVIPPIHLKYFDVNEETKFLERLILPTYDVPSHSSTYLSNPQIKSPILMMSSVGEEEGLLNLFHGMEETDHIHITFIQHSEVLAYQKQWPNHIFVCLPNSFSKASDGAVKNIMKTFATQNYVSNEAKKSAEGKAGTTWPLALFVPDNVVMWQKYWKEPPTCYSSDSDEDEGGDKKERHSNGSVRDSITRDTASLLEFLTAVESNTYLLQHALIGVRPWSSFQDEAGIPICVRTYFLDCFLLNVSKTQHIEFSAHVYAGENIDFSLKLLNENLPICRYEHFTFMLKVTTKKKWRSRDGAVLGVEPISSNDVTRFVVPPDVDTLKTIEADPHHVFQKYLKYSGPSLFPLATDNPVLIIGGYLNLGAQIQVCVVNSVDVQNELKNSKCVLSQKYSGLILYNCSQKLTKECFSCIKFVKKAKLVFVCQERAQLRNEALRLDLEEDWRFRLRDEYQTATKQVDGGKKALHFLTGTYIS